MIPLRLALREEGEFWNAYIALHDTMKGAKLIGSIAIGPVRSNEAVKQTFQDLMQTILSDAIEALTGKPPEQWNVGPAPEAERAGHG